MSTRGRIGIQLPDGSILSIYNHYDSYPEGLGAHLVKNYTTKESVEELIDMGDISSIVSDTDWSGNKVPDQVRTYAARGDTDVEPRLDANKYDYLADGEEFAYLFVNNVWICYDMHQFEENTMPTIVEIPVPVAA